MKINIKTALLSVYDKTGIVEFAQGLVKSGVTVYASGGTAKKLKDNNVPVIDIAELVGGDAILGHRVVTLSREVHAGLLAKYNVDTDMAELEKLGIPYIDLVYSNLYPLVEEIAKPESTFETVVEQTDIGGPAMLRSAVKGGRIVVYDANDTDAVLKYIKKGEEDTEFIQGLASKAEFYVASYVMASAKYRGKNTYEALLGTLAKECKYGENPFQKANLYKEGTDNPLALHAFTKIKGNPIGYNEYCDIDRLLQTFRRIASGFQANYTKERVPNIAIAVKHGNPCGASFSSSPNETVQKMVIGDQRAIFGGFIMTNFEIGKSEAESLLYFGMDEGKKRMLNGVAAPSFTSEAIDFLREHSNCMLLVNAALGTDVLAEPSSQKRFRQVEGGMLLQDAYSYVLDFSKDIVFGGKVTDDQMKNILLAWGVGSTSNSNTVTLVNDSMLIGNGVGQQDRVGCCELAVKKAKSSGHSEMLQNSVAYSDSFFPFTDGPKVLIDAGVQTIFSSSGSKMDEKVVEYCKSANVNICFVPNVVGRGFFGH